jgi:hypothetical protein
MARVLADNVVLDYTGTNAYAACLANTVYDISGNNNSRIDPGETVDLTATIKNIGGVDFTNLNSTLECDDPYITITDNLGNFGYIAVDSSKENTGDPYVISADAATPQGHSAPFRIIATEGSFIDTFDFSLVVGSYHYLLWNPDPTPEPGMAMDSLLTDLGYSGNYATTLITENLDMYRAIFVCVGIYANNHVISAGSPEATALVNYVNAGGNLYLEGGDVWYFDPLGSGYNFCPLFGIQATADGGSDCGPVAGENGTFTQEMYFQYTGENSWIDHINPTGTGFLIFHDVDNNYNCGVANYAETYKTVGLSFELGGLVDAGPGNSRRDLLDSIMNFFGITTDLAEITKLDVQAPFLQLSPNPFRNTTTIRYKIHDTGYTEQELRNSNFEMQKPSMRIYDASGRLVRSFDLESCIMDHESSLSWDGSDQRGRRLPTGVYFVRLNTKSHTETQKIILVE